MSLDVSQKLQISFVRVRTKLFLCLGLKLGWKLENVMTSSIPRLESITPIKLLTSGKGSGETRRYCSFFFYINPDLLAQV